MHSHLYSIDKWIIHTKRFYLSRETRYHNIIGETLVFAIMVIGSPLGRLHFIGWIIITILNTVMALLEEKRTRVVILVLIVVLQHITLLLFMFDYEKLGRAQWKKKEEALKKELTDTYLQYAQKKD